MQEAIIVHLCLEKILVKVPITPDMIFHATEYLHWLGFRVNDPPIISASELLPISWVDVTSPSLCFTGLCIEKSQLKKFLKNSHFNQIQKFLQHFSQYNAKISSSQKRFLGL